MVRLQALNVGYDAGMARMRKPNRDAGPVRITQRGTSTAYPHAHHRAMAAARDRYYGEHDQLNEMMEGNENDEHAGAPAETG